LLSAALTAAGALTSMAQVYSVNIVGYVSQPVAPAAAGLGAAAGGSVFIQISNPLTDNKGNLATNVLDPASVASGSLSGLLLYKPRVTGGFDLNGVDGTDWYGDTIGTMTLNPGEGAIIDVGAISGATKLTYVGDVTLHADTPIPGGSPGLFLLISSAVPIEANLNDLFCPGDTGDQAFLKTGSGFTTIINDGGTWDDVKIPVATSFWFNNSTGGKPVRHWTQTYHIDTNTLTP